VTSRSEPRSYPYPPERVFTAALAGLRSTKLRVTGTDPNQGTIWADNGISAFSWGERVTVYVYRGDQGQAAVVVDSDAKWGLFTGGAHKRNHRAVFEAIEQGLGLAPGPAPPSPPQEQAPGPYPYQQQTGPTDPPQPPPGATRF
jgi:hypothetical protein